MSRINRDHGATFPQGQVHLLVGGRRQELCPGIGSPAMNAESATSEIRGQVQSSRALG
jgi:hypothetical protein